MSLKRYAAKRDAGEKAIVTALRAAGATVFHLSDTGAPDLLVGFRGRWTPIEVKSVRGNLTQHQWSRYQGCPFAIVRTPEAALKAIGAL